MRPRSLFMLLAIACAMAGLQWIASSRSPSRTVVFEDGQVLHGVLTARRFLLPEGVEVLVQDDLTVLAGDSIVIEGTLRALDGKDTETVDAPDIQLLAEGRIELVGAVLGGRGLDRTGADVPVGARGGDGSSLTLEAPELVVAGHLQGGDGGVSGRGGVGGAGGDVLVGGTATYAKGDEGSLVAGRGGDGGAHHPESLTGADGGRGGDARFVEGGAGQRLACKTSSAVFQRAAVLPLQVGDPPEQTSPPDGTPGHPGAGPPYTPPRFPPPQDGGNGTSPAQANGQPGGNGLPVRMAHAGNGGDGGPGGNGCPGPGGTGGKGGKGGFASGLAGQTGGDGGNAYSEVINGQTVYYGNGGNGGNGGPGGKAFGGDGGTGGAGGLGSPPGDGGERGRFGTAVAGAYGQAGAAGAGIVWGAPGLPGAWGTATNGGFGLNGAEGGPCPSDDDDE